MYKTGDGNHEFANDVGVDAVGDGNAGEDRAGLQAFLNNLGFERFGVRASLAHGNPDIKGYRVRLKNTRTPSPLMLEFGR